MKIIKKVATYDINNTEEHDIPIGETFSIDERIYIVVRKKPFRCGDCELVIGGRICASLRCESAHRKDKTSVSFERLL